MTEREKLTFLLEVLSVVLVETELHLLSTYHINHLCIPEMKYAIREMSAGEMPIWANVIQGTIRCGTVRHGNVFREMSIGELS